MKYPFDVFGDIYRKGLNEISQEPDAIESKMFGFAKQRIQEIEQEVEQQQTMMKKVQHKRVTKLHNEGLAKTVPQIQKELLLGKYSIHLHDKMPFS